MSQRYLFPVMEFHSDGYGGVRELNDALQSASINDLVPIRICCSPNALHEIAKICMGAVHAWIHYRASPDGLLVDIYRWNGMSLPVGLANTFERSHDVYFWIDSDVPVIPDLADSYLFNREWKYPEQKPEVSLLPLGGKRKFNLE
jgi:hypothetical protein